MSKLENKSEMFESYAKEFHDGTKYLAVGHCSYYACFQRVCHICYYVLGKKKDEIESACSQSNQGSHSYMLNLVFRRSGDRNLRNLLPQLKKLRESADYEDANFDSEKSSKSIELMNEILPILKKIRP